MRNKELFRGRRKAGRIVGLVLTLALAVSLLSGCGQSKERLTFGTGGTAGTYYSYGGVLAQYITNNTNVKVTAVSTGGSKANLQTGRRFPAWICPVRCNGLCMGGRKSI